MHVLFRRCKKHPVADIVLFPKIYTLVEFYQRIVEFESILSVHSVELSCHAKYFSNAPHIGAQCISRAMSLDNVFHRISMSLPSIFYAKHIIIFINFASLISFDSFSDMSSSLNFKIFGRL